MKIYIDGNLFPEAEARISVFDHGLLYGDGVFEGIRVYTGRSFKLEEHIRRLFMSAKAIMLDIPMSEEEMANAVNVTVRANNIGDGYVRLIVTRGKGALGLAPSLCKKPTVIIIADDIRLYPAVNYEKGVTVVTASTRRIPPDGLEPRIKSLNYLNNILARLEAEEAGCHEAVMLNQQGMVAECTVDNIFAVRQGSILTPSPEHGALDGITMRTLLELARSNGIEAGMTALTRYDLYTADECFMTGTAVEIVPVVKVDGRPIGAGTPGPVTKKMMAIYSEAVRA